MFFKKEMPLYVTWRDQTFIGDVAWVSCSAVPTKTVETIIWQADCKTHATWVCLYLGSNRVVTVNPEHDLCLEERSACVYKCGI